MRCRDCLRLCGQQCGSHAAWSYCKYCFRAILFLDSKSQNHALLLSSPWRLPYFSPALISLGSIGLTSDHKLYSSLMTPSRRIYCTWHCGVPPDDCQDLVFAVSNVVLSGHIQQSYTCVSIQTHQYRRLDLQFEEYIRIPCSQLGLCSLDHIPTMLRRPAPSCQSRCKGSKCQRAQYAIHITDHTGGPFIVLVFWMLVSHSTHCVVKTSV